MAASDDPAANRGVATRDIIIDPDTGVSARLFLPIAANPWLAAHADHCRTFLAGDSAGGNIVYHTAVRAARNGIVIEGMIMVQPFFQGAERLPSEEVWDGESVLDVNRIGLLWPFVMAGQAGKDDPRFNPLDEKIASLKCRRVLVAVAEKDSLRERGVRMLGRIGDYYAVTGGGEATLVESEGEDHGFHLYSPLRDTSRRLMESIVRFINNQPEVNAHKMNGTSSTVRTATPELVILGVPSRPFRDIFGYGMDMKKLHHSVSTKTCMMACGGTSSKGGRREKAAATFNKANYGLFTCPMGPNKAYKKGPSAAAAVPSGTQIMRNF
ncbi:unnamed protein product [Urochloa humidicola]